MHIQRRQRLESAIQKELSFQVPRMLKDPRIPSVTFTAVEMSKNGSRAIIYVSITGAFSGPPLTEEQHQSAIKKCLEGLTSSAGFLRKHFSQILRIKYVPELVFKEDKGLQNASRVFELLNELNGQLNGQLKKEEPSDA